MSTLLSNKKNCSILIALLILLIPVFEVAGLVKEEGFQTHGEIKSQSAPGLTAKTAIVFNKNTGDVIYGKNIHTKRPMGSISKLMTAIVAVDHGNLSDVVTVSSYAASRGGTSAGLQAGEKLTLEELIYAMILPSGNDAATAIAQHVGGSEKEFVSMMNKKAKELGAKNTSYTNPRGSDGSTPYDLAIIASYALDDPFLSRVISIYSYDLPGPKPGESRRLINVNIYALRGKMFEANGVKWGYTPSAGHCLIASARRDSRYIITVVFDSADHVGESVKLLEYGFQQTYVPVEKVTTDKEGTVKMDLGDAIDLQPIFTPERPTNRSVSWTSDNPDVATVTDRGRVRAVDYGQAVIKVKTDCGGKSATVKINVPYIPVESIKIDVEEMELVRGDVLILNPVILPPDATNKNVSWSSDNPESLTVRDGRITAVEVGEALISATSECGDLTASLTVKVPYVAPEEIVLESKELQLHLMGIGSKKYINAVVYPENTSYKDIVWTSEDEGVVMVAQNGLITAVSEGQAVITLKTADSDIKESCIVTVHNEGIIFGDVNGDGFVNVSDAIIVLRYVVGIHEFENEGAALAADVNHDTQINVEDAIKILRYIVGLY